MELKNVGFVYPVINRRIHVAQRNTPPHRGLYGPIGGKSESFNPKDKPMLKENLGGSLSVRVHDYFAQQRGLEYGHATAIREFFEEVFQSAPEAVSDVVYLGGVFDMFKGIPQNCQFYMAVVQRSDFNINPRELSDIRPLERVLASELFPLAKVSLAGLRFMLEELKALTIPAYRDLGLENQIPDIDPDEVRDILQDKDTSIIGAIMAKYSKIKKN